MIRNGSARAWALMLPLLLAPLDAPSAEGQDEVPRRPQEPFRVFVHANDPADAALQAKLKEALPTVQEQVRRRESWFLLTDSAKTADLILSVVNCRTGPLRRVPRFAPYALDGVLRVGPAGPDRDYYLVEAVVRSGEIRQQISGLHTGPGGGVALRGAAGHLAKEMERFARDNYGAASRAKVRARRERGEPPR